MEVVVTSNACLNATLANIAHNIPDDPAKCTSTMHMDHVLWNCDGSPNLFPGGSWIGHMLPCLLFILWSMHWMMGTFRTYFERAPGQPFVSHSHYGFLWFPREWLLEPICKFALPPFAIIAELYWAHDSYRNLMCAPTDPRAGHLNGNHLNNWAHACMYIGFIISGFVDLVGAKVQLPQGTEKLYLSLGFLLEALLMGLHQKATPMDVALHMYLTYSMLASAAAVLLEHVYPEVFLFSCSRVAAVALQALWFHATAHISFEGLAAWDTLKDKDLAPVLFVSTYFLMHILGILLVMLAVFQVMSWAYDVQPATGRRPGGDGSAAECKGLLAAEDG